MSGGFDIEAAPLIREFAPPSPAKVYTTPGQSPIFDSPPRPPPPTFDGLFSPADMNRRLAMEFPGAGPDPAHETRIVNIAPPPPSLAAPAGSPFCTSPAFPSPGNQAPLDSSRFLAYLAGRLGTQVIQQLAAEYRDADAHVGSIIR